MKMNKNEALLILAQKIMDSRIKPFIDKASTIERTIKPIKYNAALDENDYLEWLAKKNNELVHINTYRKDDEQCNTSMIIKIMKTE